MFIEHTNSEFRARFPRGTNLFHPTATSMINERSEFIIEAKEMSGIMADAKQEIVFNNSVLTAHHMPRPRLDKILDRATRCKLVYVVAGAGYGKTQAVHNYVERQREAVVRWMQLTENDNNGSHYWESLTRCVASDNPELAAKLRDLGFPETQTRFKQFAEIIKISEHRSNKTFLVLDDFHLIHSGQALTFAERCAHLPVPGACVIIISRYEPDINVVSLFARNRASIITEDELRFTEDEIAGFFKLREIPFASNDPPRFLNATDGWALAVKLLSLVLKRIPNNFERAFDAMKQNIFKLFETEAFEDFPEPFQKQLAQLYLISDLPLIPLNEIFRDALFERYAPQLASFIWFDSFFNDYRVNPLYLEFLKNKQHILSHDEKHEIYKKTSAWCFENGFYMDAMSYCAKSRQYAQMLEGLLMCPFKLPRDACEYLLDIFKEIDLDDEVEDRSVLILKCLFIPLLYAGAGKHAEAKERSLDTIRRWEGSDSPFAPYLLYIAYSNLAYIDTYVCTVTHAYEASGYLRKAVGYYKSSSVPPLDVDGPFGVVDIRGFACLVGEGADFTEFENFRESAKETALYVSQTNHNSYYGYDDLVSCELAFFTNRIDAACGHAHDAVLKAREKKQYGIEMMAQYYLLRIAIHDGDYTMTREMLNQLRAHLDNKNFWNRQQLYDLFVGSFFTHIGLHGMTPSWIAIDDAETKSGSGATVRELIVGVRHYLARGKYKQALTVLSNSHPRDPQERFYFGELILTLLSALARLKTGDEAGAAKDFAKAYEMSYDGFFEMPFVELRRAFRQLAAAAEQGGYAIPAAWLKTVGRKASAYAKKTSVIADSYKRDKQIADEIQLSERERELLNDLYNGLSREEMAATRYLSINTVNKILQSLFIKLDAKNSADAIRIGIELKMVG